MSSTLRPLPREPDDDDEPAPEYLVSADHFFSEVDEPLRWLVEPLIVARATHLLHGEPRARKSWIALELCLSAATGTPAFGRFAVAEPVPVAYLAQEDGASRIRNRAFRLLAGKGAEGVGAAVPEAMYFAVHRGINLESPEWQERLIEDFRKRDIRLAAFDPVRRFSPNCDSGPAEVRETTGFLRRITVETKAAVLIVHHDVKPPANGQDTRRRSQRASGADWFAVADCPMHAEPVGRDRTLLVPEDYKFGEAPKAFSFRIDEDLAKVWARLVADDDVEARDVDAVGLHEVILEHLRHSPGSSGSSVARGTGKRKGDVLPALERLQEAGQVDSVQQGRAVRWFIKGQA